MHKKWSKLLLFAIVALFGATLFAAVDNQILIFSTPGIDRYADGSAVLDGEYYAVVCSRAGMPFAGFVSSGALVDPVNNYLVCRLRAAEGGHCKKVRLSVPNGTLNGDVHIVMMDTRSPVTGKPGADVVLGCADVASGEWSVTAGTITATSGAVATATKMPSDIPSPVITKLELVDGVAVLHVANTVPGVYYTVQHSGTVSGFKAPVLDAFAKSSSGEGEVVFAMSVGSDSSGFFKIAVPSFGAEEGSSK